MRGKMQRCLTSYGSEQKENQRFPQIVFGALQTRNPLYAIDQGILFRSHILMQA